MNDPVAVLTGRDVIRVSGSEAASYLQGQMSQDIDAVDVGRAAWSLLLQPTGKVDAWLRVHRVESHHFVVDIDVGHGEAAITRLERFKLSTDVTFGLDAGWSMLSIRGAGAESVEVDASLGARVSWPGFEGFDHLGTDLDVPAGVLMVDDLEFEARRIAAGFPRMGTELTTDTIPAEAGSALLDSSVSFTKGCYTGQELVARIDSRGGNVPRPIRVLRSDGPTALPVGGIVVHQGAEVGTVTSSVPARPDGPALALAPILRRVEPGAAVVVAGAAATVEVAPVSPTTVPAGS